MPSKTRKNKKTTSRHPGGRALWPLAGLSRPIVLGILVVTSTIGLFLVANTHAAAQPVLKSDVGNYCLTDDNNGGVGSYISAYQCSGAAAQYFSYRSNGEMAVGAGCIIPQGAGNGVKGGPFVVISPCLESNNTLPWGAAWTVRQAGDGNEVFENNHAGECLHATAGSSVTVAACDTGAASQQWIITSVTPAPTGGGGGGGGGGSGNNGSIVSIAQQFVGKEYETPNGCNCGGAIIDGANIDTFQGLPQRTNPGYAAGWCAAFASWVYWKAGDGLASRGSYVPTLGVSSIDAWFGSHGHWYSNNATNRADHPPQSGDFVDYDSGAHGGIVYSEGTNLTTIDGNYANSVSYDTTYSWKSGSAVTGWGSF